MQKKMDNLIGPPKRIWELDAFRGLAVVLMIVDHLLIDISMLPQFFNDFFYVSNPFLIKLYNFGNYYIYSHIRQLGHDVFSFVFLFITGISCTFSRSNFTRACQIGAAALGISVVFIMISNYMGESYYIMFGILHCLSVSIFLYLLVKSVLKKDIFLLLIGGAIIFCGIMFAWYDNTYIPALQGDSMQQTFNNVMSVIIGTNFYGEDCFGLVPYTGVLFLGGYFGAKMYDNKKSLLPSLDGNWNRAFCFVGRHSLVIYLLHQIIIPVILVILGLSLGLSL